MLVNLTASEELGDLMRDLVSQLEETVASLHYGMTVLSTAVESGTLEQMLNLMAAFTVEAVVAIQQYSELQMQWMLSGY